MALKSVMILSVFLYLICFSISIQSSQPEQDEDLTFLEQDKINDAESSDSAHPYGHPRDYENFDDLEDDDDLSAYTDDDASYSASEVDETHVLVLKESNFSEFLQKNRFVMVEFYAPWCGHCQALAPEYAEMAAELKDEEVVLAKIDATEEPELPQKFDAQGFPTVYVFVDGIQKPYTGHRTKDSIVSWLKKKMGPVLQNITAIEEAQSILASQDKLVLGYLESSVGSDGEELGAAQSSKMMLAFTRQHLQMWQSSSTLILSSNVQLWL